MGPSAAAGAEVDEMEPSSAEEVVGCRYWTVRVYEDGGMHEERPSAAAISALMPI